MVLWCEAAKLVLDENCPGVEQEAVHSRAYASACSPGRPESILVDALGDLVRFGLALRGARLVLECYC